MDKPFYSRLGEELRRLRLRRRWRQVDIAHELGVSVRTIQRIEYGEHRPAGDLVTAWCSKCGGTLSVCADSPALR